MAAKNVIILKLVETYANLNSINPALGNGQEVIVDELATTYDVTNKPKKIGDGTTLFNALFFTDLIEIATDATYDLTQTYIAINDNRVQITNTHATNTISLTGTSFTLGPLATGSYKRISGTWYETGNYGQIQPWLITTTYGLDWLVIDSELMYISKQAGNTGHTPVGGAGDLWWKLWPEAVGVSIVDAGGYYTGTEVETALQEAGAHKDGDGSDHADVATNTADVATNTADIAFNTITNPNIFALLGTGLSITGVGAPALAALSSTDVAFIDNSNDELRTYRFNGSTWSQVGSSLSIAGVSFPALAALSSTDVVFIDSGNDELRTYRFNGSTWTQVGSSLSITLTSFPALAALSSTDVAFIDTQNADLRTYRFNGSTWSQVGSDLNLSSIGTLSLTALSATDVAFVDATNSELRTYRFNGSTWSQVGSSLSVGSVLAPIVAALSSIDVAFIDATNADLRVYRFNGSTWAQIGSDLNLSSVGNCAIMALSNIDIAFIDGTNDELRAYTLSLHSVPPSPAFIV